MNDEKGQSENKRSYWFPAKTFGWGWGLAFDVAGLACSFGLSRRHLSAAVHD